MLVKLLSRMLMYSSIIESAVLGCSGLVIGASLASEDGWTSPIVLSALIIGIIVFNLFTPIANFIWKNQF